jgi:prepilin peptidase CpaA
MLDAGLLFSLVFASAVTDLLTGKIYNVLIYPGIALGVVMSVFLHPPNLWQSLIGLAGGFGMYYLLRRVAGLGAGDVKLMAAVGAFRGFPFVLLSSFYVFAAGGVLGVLVLAHKGKLLRTLRWVGSSVVSLMFRGAAPAPPESGPTMMRFGPAICLGVGYSLYLELTRGPMSLAWWL